MAVTSTREFMHVAFLPTTARVSTPIGTVAVGHTVASQLNVKDKHAILLVCAHVELSISSCTAFVHFSDTQHHQNLGLACSALNMVQLFRSCCTDLLFLPQHTQPLSR